LKEKEEKKGGESALREGGKEGKSRRGYVARKEVKTSSLRGKKIGGKGKQCTGKGKGRPGGEWSFTMSKGKRGKKERKKTTWIEHNFLRPA